MLDGDRPAVPLHATSSAGGGLAMVVTGLVKKVTSRSAELAALGAGAVLLDTVALDDGRVPWRKVEALRRVRPDLLLFAGGFDGAAISRVTDINPGALDFSPTDMMIYKGLLYFAGDDGTDGVELWQYDGLGVSLAADINQTALGASSTPLPRI